MAPKVPTDDRESLLDDLAELVARAGWERFVLAPLIEPTDAFFPDRYVHEPTGVRTVARRLLRHAGIEDLDVRVIDLRPTERVRSGLLAPLTAAWFAGIESSGVPTLEVELHELGEDADVVPVVAHEIARAFRAYRRLDRAGEHPYRGGAPEEEHDPELDARLGSIAALYLGFGILAANGAHRYRAKGEQIGRDARTEWSHDQVGGLDATEVSFLLAVQLVVRGAERSTVERVRRMLLANQSSDVGAWVDALAGDAEALRERLGIPPPSAWPAPWPPDLGPLHELLTEDTVVRPAELSVHDRQRRNEGRRVFRVLDTLATPWMGRGVALGLASMVVALGVSPSPSALLLLPIGGIVGWMMGARRRNDTCSDPECGALLALDATTCAACGGTVAGDIARASDRLAAEEALEDRTTDEAVTGVRVADPEHDDLEGDSEDDDDDLENDESARDARGGER